MPSALYFAYGSNLLLARLKARCPSARVVGVAATEGWAVSFTKPGADGSGKAGLVQNPGAVHPGVVYELAVHEIPELDRIEGVGHGYTRDDEFQVTMLDGGKSVATTTYLPQRHDPVLMPFDWYLALCIAGAIENRFDAHVLAAFRSTPYTRDAEQHRPARQAGIMALQAAGHHDWQTML